MASRVYFFWRTQYTHRWTPESEWIGSSQCKKRSSKGDSNGIKRSEFVVYEEFRRDASLIKRARKTYKRD
jgi:hypothetical protein